MTTPDDQPYRLTITIPRLEGYKTLVVNAATVVVGVLALVRPQWVLPDPETVGLAYDQMAGGVALLLGAVNTLLRLNTRGPVPSAVNVLGMQPKLTHPAVKAYGEHAYYQGIERGKQAAALRDAVRQTAVQALQTAEDAALRRTAARQASASPDGPVCAHDWSDRIGGMQCKWCGAWATNDDVQCEHECTHTVQSSGTPNNRLAFWLAFALPSALLTIAETGSALARVVS